MKSRFLSTPAVSSQLAISLKVNVDTLLYAATPLPQCKMCPEVGQTDILKYMTSVIKKKNCFLSILFILVRWDTVTVTMTQITEMTMKVQ